MKKQFKKWVKNNEDIIVIALALLLVIAGIIAGRVIPYLIITR